MLYYRKDVFQILSEDGKNRIILFDMLKCWFFKELSKKTGKDRRSMSEAGLSGKIRSVFICPSRPFVSKILDLWLEFCKIFVCKTFIFKHNIHEVFWAATTTRLNEVRARALAGFSTAFFGSLIPSERMVSVARSTQPPEYGANAGMPKRSVMVATKESVTVSSPCTTKRCGMVFLWIHQSSSEDHSYRHVRWFLQGLQYGH